MAEEEKNQENQEQEKSQEELAKEWEEALKAQQGGGENQEDIMSAWEEALKQQQGTESESTEESEETEETSEEIPEELKEEKERIELLKDIPLEISVEIGSTVLPLEEILKLHPNSIVELDRFINEPVDVKINGRLVAKGKLYTVKENFGIKITQIITPEERLKLLEE